MTTRYHDDHIEVLSVPPAHESRRYRHLEPSLTPEEPETSYCMHHELESPYYPREYEHDYLRDYPSDYAREHLQDYSPTEYHRDCRRYSELDPSITPEDPESGTPLPIDSNSTSTLTRTRPPIVRTRPRTDSRTPEEIKKDKKVARAVMVVATIMILSSILLVTITLSMSDHIDEMVRKMNGIGTTPQYEAPPPRPKITTTTPMPHILRTNVTQS